ncbi:MAG: hypothetical protein ACD_79C00049G0001 [uncultured bacterium]|nr:MAG: hypothetical protein ACD_79C00049G0001 [uncultured bacterium]
MNSIYPLLKFTNSVDPDNDSISYEVQLSFDIPISLFDPNAKISFSSGSIKQGDMETFWKVNIPLTENTCYDWKIIATDEHGLKTESDINSFYVNLSNNAPLCPELKAPVFNSEIQVQSVNLIVENVPNPDTDNDTVYYNFEIDISRNFDSPDKIVSGLLSEGTDGFTSWSVSNLSDNQKYFWRAKATDVSTDSEWVYGEFIVNLENDVPSIPTFKNPGNLSQVETLIPILEANPSLDVDKDVLSYQFEIYDDKSLNNRIEFGNSNFPSYQLNQTLNDKTFYYWRVKTVDAHGFESNWSAVGRFFVKDNLINDPPQIKILEPSKDIITNKNTFDITWEDLDMDSNATVTLYYTQTKWQAGVIITSGIEEDADGENDCFNWDISAVGDGSYYVYVEISDGNETVTSYSQNVLTVDKAKPVVSAFPPGGIYIANQNVQLSVNETAEIYYTTDGSEPNLTSVRYSNPIEISDLTTLKFIARDSAGNLSTVKTEDYIVGAKTNVQLSDVPDWTPNISPSWTWTEPSGLPNFEGYAICLDSEPEVFTTETSYTAPPLSEGNHTFSVKVKYAGIFGEISTDEFGIDTTPPLLESVVINNGEAGTTDRSITLNINHNNDGVAGSGIQSTLVKIDNGEFTDLTGNTLTLPETIGLHTVSVKLIDNVGLESEIKSDNIILASVLNKISGTSSNGDKAILTDLMSNFKVTANIINNGFIFENIPEGLYGLVVENANSIAAYKGRISLFGSSNFNAGEITISNELGGITGIVTQNDLPQTDMDVSLCVNLGQGYFLPIKKAVSDIYGSYDMQNIPAGLYCLKSQNKNLSFIESNPLQVVKINALETINAEIIIGGVNLSGVVNTSEIILKVFNEQLLSWETLTNTDSYSLGLPNGNYTLIAKSIYKYLEPLLFSIEGLPVTKNLNFIDKQFSILGSVLNAETIIVDNDEPFLRKSLQLYSNNNRYILPVSNEITSSGLIKTYDDSVNNENWILCLIADDFGKDIHSINLVPASITAQAYSIVNAGGKISGIITYKGEPYQKPIALLYNSSDELIGRCEGSFYGEYFFKNVPPASDYKIKATLFGVEETFEVNSIELLEGENKTNVNLNIGDNTPPVIVAQSNIIAEVISKTGTPVNIPVTASDDYDANPEIVINGPALFPLGNTSVQITAKDNSGNESTKTITVTVKDTTKPVFTSFPPDRAVESVGTKTIVELKTPLASDIFNVTITNDAPIDGFSAGVTIVTWMAKDENENYITAQQKIKVCDTSLVGNLQNNSTNPYSKTISDNNIAPYTDRTYVIKSLPDILIGSVLIKTPNSDKSSQQADILKITPSNDAEVYIAYDLRALAIGKPAFLSLYYDETTLNIEVKETGDYVNCLRLFKKKVNVLSGETVSFSGNQYGYSNYLIFLKESQPASGQTNLSKINFTRSGYLLDSFNPASSPYTDRLNYTFYQYPGFLENSQIIRTPNNDKSIANANIIDMTFSNQCYVYVAYDIRNVLLNNIPAFLTGFEDMGVDVKVTEGSYGINTLRLFRKEFNANVQMFLSGNQYGNSNYFVFIKSSKSLPLITSFFSRNDQQYKVKALSDVIEAYSDRTHTLNHSSLPVYLKDALYIQTPNSDKYINQTEMVMSFTAGMQPINVYVAYDKKLYETGCTPLFLNAFELLPEGITIVEGAYGINDLILFCSTVQPNQTIELYGNNGNAESNYVVFVTKS